ncbi:hypothetical protein BT63DRAFT_289706 [Microthyrium microscopicum]|uniref:Uncharacterized protein n=1 Tax=Microthyrium microscopicum TaxID=703497 RepID=A0A6A6U8T5_9PEZI|nr:hypothetical protein BT63DRAFT_289706 [Microthyrium microscopicum]
MGPALAIAQDRNPQEGDTPYQSHYNRDNPSARNLDEPTTPPLTQIYHQLQQRNTKSTTEIDYSSENEHTATLQVPALTAIPQYTQRHVEHNHFISPKMTVDPNSVHPVTNRTPVYIGVGCLAGVMLLLILTHYLLTARYFACGSARALGPDHPLRDAWSSGFAHADHRGAVPESGGTHRDQKTGARVIERALGGDKKDGFAKDGFEEDEVEEWGDGIRDSGLSGISKGDSSKSGGMVYQGPDADYWEAAERDWEKRAYEQADVSRTAYYAGDIKGHEQYGGMF